MAKFDVMEAAISGYRYLWQERKIVLPLAVVPFFVKMGSFAAVLLLGLEANILRQGLLLLPAYFMEALWVAVIIRMAMFGERYDRGAAAQGRIDENVKRAVMGAALIYVLTKLVTYFLSGIMMMSREIEKSPMMPEPNGAPFLTLIMIVLFMVWAFRFLWLYVPVATGVPVRRFLEIIRPFVSSVYLIALWMLCSIPISAALLGAARLLMAAFPGVDGQGSMVYTVLLAPLRAAAELGIAGVTGVAMAHALRVMVGGQGGPGRRY